MKPAGRARRAAPLGGPEGPSTAEYRHLHATITRLATGPHQEFCLADGGHRCDCIVAAAQRALDGLRPAARLPILPDRCDRHGGSDDENWGKACRECLAEFYVDHCAACELPLPAAPLVVQYRDQEQERVCDAACEARLQSWHAEPGLRRVWANHVEPPLENFLRVEHRRAVAQVARLEKRVSELERALADAREPPRRPPPKVPR
jgi:hypothetical protein